MMIWNAYHSKDIYFISRETFDTFTVFKNLKKTQKSWDFAERGSWVNFLIILSLKQNADLKSL